MARRILIWIFLGMIAASFLPVMAQDSQPSPSPPAEKSDPAEEDLKIIEDIEILTLMEFLKDMELVKELDLFLEEKTHEKDD